ncbi:AAA family ATPase [Rhodoferax bucti]|uniref:AAA family ATPase n=1 Tax=Rhodoferax bucti TaxID=2576305 RepID=UPI001108434F|nr:AAA family ATPase [Rhodoferax bucti]
MYLRSIQLKNTGPIRDLNLVLPFEGENPKPLLLVGRNGSGKSTVISFVVNALVALKQQIYEDVEVDKGKVYRIRSPLGIHGDAQFYFAKIEFEKGVSLIEWQLNNARETITDLTELQTLDTSCHEIPVTETSHFKLPLGELAAPHLLEATLQKTSLLFFPADRFEPPDWLNTESLSTDLQLPEQVRMKGRTARRILSRNRLKPTLEWLHAVIFDMMVSEYQPVAVPLAAGAPPVNARIAMPGKAHAVFLAVQAVLQKVLCRGPDEQLQLGIGHRNQRIITATIRKNGEIVRVVKDMLSLSAGESALFCLFASIIRDADMSAMDFQATGDIAGIVLIDEADLHLHMGLQFEVLPQLMQLFPKVQFIVSVHAPLVALGMDRVFGTSGFELREMPTGAVITPESYSEFQTALNTFAETRAFQNAVLNQVNAGTLPALLVEGKTDATLISVAWGKLNPGIPMPFEIIPCGIDPEPEKRDGGAEMLRRCTEFLSIVSDRKITAIFDNDAAGCNAFNSLQAKAGFNVSADQAHKKHVSKPIQAIVLPVPMHRADFASSVRADRRHFSIEHYFSDALLATHGLKGEPVAVGSMVFDIDATAKQKVAFTEASTGFDGLEFVDFKTLFERIAALPL